MLRTILVTASALIAPPVLAQTGNATGTQAPTTQVQPPVTAQAPLPSATPTAPDPVATLPNAAPQTTAPAAMPAPAGTATPVPVPPTANTPNAASTETAGGAAATTTNAPSDVAGVVQQGFPTYDANANGTLNRAEFDRWMLALRHAADPGTSDTGPATRTYLTGAFRTADANRNGTITREELTTFLTRPEA